MSEYKDFKREFPRRVLRELTNKLRKPNWKENNVTSMLLIANGFLLPFESYRGIDKGVRKNAFEKKDKLVVDLFHAPLYKFLYLQNKKRQIPNEEKLFVDFEFLREEVDFDVSSDSEVPVKLRNKELLQRFQPFDKQTDLKTLDIFFDIRNALAHCNIWFDSEKEGCREITTLWFASSKCLEEDKRYKLKVYKFSPENFLNFLIIVIGAFADNPSLMRGAANDVYDAA